MALRRPISFQTAEVYEISRELLMLVDGEMSFCGATMHRGMDDDYRCAVMCRAVAGDPIVLGGGYVLAKPFFVCGMVCRRFVFPCYPGNVLP